MKSKTVRSYSIALLFVVWTILAPAAASVYAQTGVNQTQLTFSAQPVGTSSAAQTIIVSNNGAPILMGAALLDGIGAVNFRVTNGCYLQQLPTGGNCAISVGFAPLHVGTLQAELQFADVAGLYQRIIFLSGQATGTEPIYTVPSYRVTVLDNNVPAGASLGLDLSNLYFNNHDQLAGNLVYPDSGCGIFTGDSSHVDPFFYANGQYTDLTTLPGSPLAFTEPSTGCRSSSFSQGFDDAGEIFGFGFGTFVPPNFRFVYANGSVQALQQLVMDGSTLAADQIPVQVFSTGLVLFRDNTYYQNGQLKTLPCPFVNTPPNLPPFCVDRINGGGGIFNVAKLGWDTAEPFAPSGCCGQDFTRENAEGVAPGSTTTFENPRLSAVAAVFASGVITDTGFPNSYLHSVNAAGQGVGVVGVTSSGGAEFYWDPKTGVHFLSDLVQSDLNFSPATLPGPLYGVPYINDVGHILAFADDSAGNTHIVLLTPIVTTPTGSNVVLQSGAATLTFNAVTGSGTTTVQPIDASSSGAVPGGFAVSDTVAYQITTTATFSGPVTIAFAVPGPISQTDFNNLRILHNDNGNLVDITTSYDYTRLTIYGTTNSFSPFYIARRGPHISALFDETAAHKAGSTIPVKLQVLDANNNNLSCASLPVKARGLLRIADSAELKVVDSGNSSPDSNFRYDSTIGTSGGYIFNLSTKGLATGTYSLSMYVGNDKQYAYGVTFGVR